MSFPDNFSQWARHDAEQESELDKLPVCEYCEECMNANFRKEVVPDYE